MSRLGQQLCIAATVKVFAWQHFRCCQHAIEWAASKIGSLIAPLADVQLGSSTGRFSAEVWVGTPYFTFIPARADEAGGSLSYHAVESDATGPWSNGENIPMGLVSRSELGIGLQSAIQYSRRRNQ